MIPADYLERVYAGVLGKLIGVYLGRPVENWSYERIAETFGEIDRYVHQERGRRLVVTDDDITGTFVFLRALEEYGLGVTPAQIGETWLNAIVEGRTILWWGGLGNSTEHTAYLRLKRGIEAPHSGSAELNGRVAAEQIGAQIFIDGWGLVCPGDPARAADLARRAASVSHDGEAIHGAQVVAAMVAAAFVETSVDALIDAGLAQIPADGTIRRLIDDLRAWHATGEDWRASRRRLEAAYGYDKYPGVCHIVPNHGLVILALLHGGGDFDLSMKIVNTCGWDTDCNAGNVGCVLGVLRGLGGISEEWRVPVADRLYLPSAEGGRAITDAAQVARWVAGLGIALFPDEEPLGESWPSPWGGVGVGSRASRPPNFSEPGEGATPPNPHPTLPQGGGHDAREGHSPETGDHPPCFDFALPGSVQGWMPAAHEDGALRIRGRASTPTFIPPHIKDLVTGYVLVANPTLYPGQTMRARLREGSGRLFVSHYGPEDESVTVWGPEIRDRAISWTIPDTGGYPIHEVGIEGDALLDWLDWDGVPTTRWPAVTGTMAGRAWADSLDRFNYVRDKFEFLVKNEGIGLLTMGDRTWRDYRVRARLTPRMALSAGLAVRYQGLRRYVAFLFGAPGEIRFERVLDGRRVLAAARFDWEPYRDYDVTVEAQGSAFRAFIDGRPVLECEDGALAGGGFGFVVEEGCLGAADPEVSPL